MSVILYMVQRNLVHYIALSCKSLAGVEAEKYTFISLEAVSGYDKINVELCFNLRGIPVCFKVEKYCIENPIQ